MWFSFFGVTSSDVKEPPAFTRVLGMNSVGRGILKEVKKIGKISVLTKAADESSLSDNAKTQKMLSDKADSVFQLTKPALTDGSYSIRKSPFVLT